MANDVDENREDLAAEYVLGTLQGNARLQFERMLREDADMRQRVHEWESRLFVLTDGIRTIKPRRRVWKSIQKRINPQARSGIWHHLGWWRAWGLAASMMLVVVSVYLVQLQQPPEQLPPSIAVLSDKSSSAGWVVQADYNKKLIVAQALKVSDPGKDKAYELWMLPKDEPPRSMGLLPLAGKRSVSLTEEKLAVLKRSGALAVSLEPSGGSPTGLPTGPVLYQGKILNI
jgi:anti-sigma-K factor RskA